MSECGVRGAWLRLALGALRLRSPGADTHDLQQAAAARCYRSAAIFPSWLVYARRHRSCTLALCPEGLRRLR